MTKVFLWGLGVVGFLLVALFATAWLTTYHPAAEEPAPVACDGEAPRLQPGQKLKVMNWNVQYMAGKNYVFYYDVPGDKGPDDRPSSQDIQTTFEGVAKVIRDENPDVILIQEIDQGAKRTDYEDQIARLLELLPDDYKCHSSAWYWKGAFVPHPRVMGSVGMKLATISKYRIDRAVRHQLPEIPHDFVTKMFYLKRAVLETRLPVEGSGDELVVLNTHLDAFAQGTDTMQRQVAVVVDMLETLSNEGKDWIIGGDFNLLPPVDGAYDRLQDREKAAYLPATELAPLFEQYQAVPGEEETSGPDYAKWFTHFANDPRVGKPDRTIDYVFLSETVKLGKRHVRQHDTMALSDHFPVIVEFELSR